MSSKQSSSRQAVKVVIRTRPTPNFCSKNLNIDPVNSVSRTPVLVLHDALFVIGKLIYLCFLSIACYRPHSKERERRFHKQCHGELEVQVRQDHAQLISRRCFRLLCSRDRAASGQWLQRHSDVLRPDGRRKDIHHERIYAQLQV